jgi:transposase InsO family protein
VKCRAIVATPSLLPLARRCALVGISRSGFYAWRSRQPSRRAQANARLVVAMQQIHAEVDRTYGSPRMQRELTARGLACGRHRVARLMRRQGLRAKQARRFRVTTDSAHGYRTAPNRVARCFHVLARDRVWMADLTAIPTAEGWSYLAVVLDAFSRRVVGWALSRALTAELPLTALRQALDARRPRPGLVHHSDQGVQYACAAYQAVLERHGLQPSMSRLGDCWDNAVVESFFHTLKVERVYDRRYATREQAATDLEDYIEQFYNRQRRHSTLGLVSPVTFEMLHAA